MFFFRQQKKEPSLTLVSFFQASGLVIYCSLVGLLFWRGDKWFGPITSYLGPILLLTLFVTSALISALLVLGYPIILFWDKKQTTEAVKLVIYTTGWLILFILLLLSILTIAKNI
jgi:hypothetical protein